MSRRNLLGALGAWSLAAPVAELLVETADPLPTTAGSKAPARSFHAVDAPLVAR